MATAGCRPGSTAATPAGATYGARVYLYTYVPCRERRGWALHGKGEATGEVMVGP